MSRESKSGLRIPTITQRFGTYRGLVRLVLARAQVLRIPEADLRNVRRLVFVCHGNICRSAYAAAFTRCEGMQAISCGLSVSVANPAHGPIVEAAARRTVDMTSHRSTSVGQIIPQPGDLFLVMEVRQLARLRNDPRFAHARIDLLGRYGGKPHLHDPYSLSNEFVETSLSDIERSVSRLLAKLRALPPIGTMPVLGNSTILANGIPNVMPLRRRPKDR